MIRYRIAGLVASCILHACADGSPPPAPPGGPSLPVPAAASSQVQAGAIERVTIHSTVLGKKMSASVYLPPGYSPATIAYPVLYLFYGYGGSQDSFFDAPLAMHRVADRLIATGVVEPLIIVVPAYDNGFGVNSTAAQAPDSAGGSIGGYEDYLIGEMLPAVEARFAVDQRRERRFIGGVSMGGFAALHLGLRHRTLFGKIGGHSAALWNYSTADQFTGQRDWLYPTTALRAARDPLMLASTADLQGLRIYLDVGDRDLLRVQDEALAGVLRSRGADLVLHTGQGGHDLQYWSAMVPAWLTFYGGRNDGR